MFGHQNDQQNQSVNDSPVPDSIVNSPLNNDIVVTPPAPTLVQPASAVVPAATEPQFGSAVPAPASQVSSDSPADQTLPTPIDNNSLLDIKQQALQQLSPLVGHLEQTPEEKFRTTMMMIQASDNQALINDAYTAAQAISDEKSRAQALLDVVNEINYFTQNHES